MMTRAERAKQFAPFDAMKGLQEALRDREERHSRVDKHEISDEMVERNSRTILKLQPGMKVEIYYYSAFHDITKRGTVIDVDFVLKRLRLDGEWVGFDDIYSIKITTYK